MRVVDGDSLLTPQTMEKLVRAVLQAFNEQVAYNRRFVPNGALPAA